MKFFKAIRLGFFILAEFSKAIEDKKITIRELIDIGFKLVTRLNVRVQWDVSNETRETITRLASGDY